MYQELWPSEFGLSLRHVSSRFSIRGADDWHERKWLRSEEAESHNLTWLIYHLSSHPSRWEGENRAFFPSCCVIEKKSPEMMICMIYRMMMIQPPLFLTQICWLLEILSKRRRRSSNWFNDSIWSEYDTSLSSEWGNERICGVDNEGQTRLAPFTICVSDRCSLEEENFSWQQDQESESGGEWDEVRMRMRDDGMEIECCNQRHNL